MFVVRERMLLYCYSPDGDRNVKNLRSVTVEDEAAECCEYPMRTR